MSVAMRSETLSLEDVRQWFDREGVTVQDWALAHSFRPENVYAVLSGRTRGRRGEAHRIAVELGLKTRSTGTETPQR